MGCGSSVPISSSIVNGKGKSTLPPIHAVKRVKPTDTAERAVNLEPVSLVSLHPDLDANERELRALVNSFLRFDDESHCEEFLLDPSTSSLIFLILPGGDFGSFLSRIHQLNKIAAIYVFDSTSTAKMSRRWTNEFVKVKGIFRERDELRQRISADVDAALNFADLIPVTVYSRLDAVQGNGNGNGKDHLRFLFYQIFLQQFCFNASANLNEKDFIEQIRPFYASNRRLSRLLDQFEAEYRSSANALHWFTDAPFLRRVLTESLLKLRISLIFAARFFIRDLHKAMRDERASLSTRTRFGSGRATTNEQIFYRGQALAKETFQKLKASVGKPIDFSSFD